MGRTLLQRRKYFQSDGSILGSAVAAPRLQLLRLTQLQLFQMLACQRDEEKLSQLEDERQEKEKQQELLSYGLVSRIVSGLNSILPYRYSVSMKPISSLTEATFPLPLVALGLGLGLLLAVTGNPVAAFIIGGVILGAAAVFSITNLLLYFQSKPEVDKLQKEIEAITTKERELLDGLALESKHEVGVAGLGTAFGYNQDPKIGLVNVHQIEESEVLEDKKIVEGKPVSSFSTRGFFATPRVQEEQDKRTPRHTANAPDQEEAARGQRPDANAPDHEETPRHGR